VVHVTVATAVRAGLAVEVALLDLHMEMVKMVVHQPQVRRVLQEQVFFKVEELQKSRTYSLLIEISSLLNWQEHNKKIQVNMIQVGSTWITILQDQVVGVQLDSST
jgi:hypothetical protein